MFDTRNKAQPKLVYARMPKNDAFKTDHQTLTTANKYQVPASSSNDLKVSLPQANNSLTIINNAEAQRQLSLLTDMQKDKEQGTFNHQLSQLQKQQQQQGEMRQKTPKHQPNITVVEVISTKKQQPTPGTELRKIPIQDIRNENSLRNNTKHEPPGELRMYRSQEYEGSKRPVKENLQASSSSSVLSVDREKMFTVSTAASRPETLKHVSSSDTSNANFLRHPRTHSDSSSTQKRSPMSPQSPNQYPNQQQRMLYQQHQPSKRHPEVHIDIPPHHEDSRIRPEVVRVRSYSAGRQPVPATLHSTSYKPAHPGQTWSIPRVSTATRPHSLNVPSPRHDDGGSRSPTSPQEFSSYNPSASPRALRSHLKPPNVTTLRQLSAPNSTSSSNSSSNPPKSILKNTAIQEQSDVVFNFRPLLLPRAHSEKNKTFVPRDFDFSTILATNKDILSGKVPTIQVTGQAPDHTTSVNSRQPLQRPLSVGAGGGNYDLTPYGRPIRKSVTFNSLVHLHDEDRVSTVRSLLADA